LISYLGNLKVQNENETKLLAADFAGDLKIGEKVILNGELGAGKTFFIKSALKSLGINNVSSPSFAIVNEYVGKNRFFHFDFYRLQNMSELYDIGWQDYLNDDEVILFVEWGNLIPKALPSKRIEINIDMKIGTSREFKFVRYE
jgi:tRNA threonylcarbamoyladenosine biosynthesis protein TsaE